MSNCHFFHWLHIPEDNIYSRMTFTEQSWRSSLCNSNASAGRRKKKKKKKEEGHTEHTEMFLRRGGRDREPRAEYQTVCGSGSHVWISVHLTKAPFIHGIMFGYWYEWNCHFICIIKWKSVSPQSTEESENATHEHKRCISSAVSIKTFIQLHWRPTDF